MLAPVVKSVPSRRETCPTYFLWRSFEILGMENRLSSAYRPTTDTSHKQNTLLEEIYWWKCERIH